MISDSIIKHSDGTVKSCSLIPILGENSSDDLWVEKTYANNERDNAKTITFQEKVAKPVATQSGNKIYITCDTSGADIYYTIISIFCQVSSFV